MVTDQDKRYAPRDLTEVMHDLWKALGGPQGEITQAQLGQKLSISQGNISTILSGGKKTQWQKHFSAAVKLVELCRQNKIGLLKLESQTIEISPVRKKRGAVSGS